MYFAAKVSIYLLIYKKKQSYFSFFNDKISFFKFLATKFGNSKEK